MKKVIAITVVLVLLLAAPWLTGALARQRIDHAFKSVSKQAPYIKVVESKWTGGWLHSEHLTTFELVLPPGVTQQMPAALQFKPIRLSLRDVMLHGPILGGSGIGLARLESHLVLSEETRKKLVDVLGTDDPVQVVTRLGLFGGTNTTVSGKGRSVELRKLSPTTTGGTIAWDDFKLAVGIGNHANTYDVNGRLPRVEVRDDKAGTHLLVNDLMVKGSGSKVSGDLYDGGATFGIGKLSLVSAGKPVTDIAAMEYRFNAGKKGDFMDYSLQVGSGAVKSTDLDATGLQLKEAHFDLTLRHLHIETLQKMLTGIEEANGKEFKLPADAQSALTQPLKEQGIALIKHDPELAIDRIGIMTPQGDALIKGTLKLEGVVNDDLVGDGMTLLPKIAADFTIEVAEALLDKIPNGATLAGTIVDQGYLKRDGTRLVSHIEFKQGALLVNGKAPQMPQNLQIPGLTPPPAAPPKQPPGGGKRPGV